MKAHVPLLILILLMVPLGSAQIASNAAGSAHSITRCSTRELAAIAGIITASTVEACFNSPEQAMTATSTKALSWNVQGPDVPTGGVAAFTPSTVSTSGCTIGSWTTVSEILAAGTGASSYATLTMTSGECLAFVRMTVTAGAIPTTLATFTYSVNIVTSDNVVNSGTLNTIVSGSMTNTLTGSVNAALSGTVTVADDANGWAIHQDPLTGTINVVSSGGLNVAVTSWPDLLSTLSGSVGIYGTNATMNSTSNTTNVFPSTIKIDGLELLSAAFIFPILLFVALVIWAEITGNLLIYVLAILAGMIAVINVTGLNTVRIILVSAMLFLAGRAYMARSNQGIED